jgi:hypothetical protein
MKLICIRVSEIGCPGHMPHSCGQVPATCQSSTGQLDISEHETTKYTPNDFIKVLVISIDICIPEVKSNIALRTGCFTYW